MFFLFGRKKLIKTISFPKCNNDFTILEVGCGTGKNIINLAEKFPSATITGIDISPEMLTIAKRKTQQYKNIKLSEQSFLNIEPEKYDIIVFSYILTMINPDWEIWINSFAKILKPNGVIYIVDFHDTKLTFFKNHMSNHHVVMDGQILEKLKTDFETTYTIKPAFLGIWTYFSAKITLKN